MEGHTVRILSLIFVTGAMVSVASVSWAAGSFDPSTSRPSTQPATVQGYPVPTYRLSETEAFNKHLEEIDPKWKKTEKMVGPTKDQQRWINYTNDNGKTSYADEYYTSDGKTLLVRNLTIIEETDSSQKIVKRRTRSWHRNGRASGVSQYLNNRPDGRFLRWAEDGTPVADNTFVNGTGAHVIFYPSGKLESVYPLEEGREHGLLLTYYASGKLKSAQRDVHGKIEGPNMAYYDDGKIRFFSYYVNGKLNGPYLGLTPKGKLETSLLFLDENQVDLKTYNLARRLDPKLIPVPASEVEKAKLPYKYKVE